MRFLLVEATGFAPLAARPSGRLSIVQFCQSVYDYLQFEAKQLFFRKTALLTQSCSLRSVTLTLTYRRSLISSLKSVDNAFLNGQLVPQIPSQSERSKKYGKPFGLPYFLVEATGFEPTTSWSRTMRATNCATPRIVWYIITDAFSKVKSFSPNYSM